MKKFDLKSIAAGIIIGTLGVTTVFAATGIKSAALSSTGVTLNDYVGYQRRIGEFILI